MPLREDSSIKFLKVTTSSNCSNSFNFSLAASNVYDLSRNIFNARASSLLASLVTPRLFSPTTLRPAILPFTGFAAMQYGGTSNEIWLIPATIAIVPI